MVKLIMKKTICFYANKSLKSQLSKHSFDNVIVDEYTSHLNLVKDVFEETTHIKM